MSKPSGGWTRNASALCVSRMWEASFSSFARSGMSLMMKTRSNLVRRGVGRLTFS